MATEASDPAELTDEDIEASLRAGDADRWQALWEAADSLKPADRRAVWSRDGHASYSDRVERILALWSALLVVRPLDWIAWGGLGRYPDGAGLDGAPVAEAVRLATAIVRADRFTEGTVESALQDGSFDAILSRLRAWHDRTA